MMLNLISLLLLVAATSEGTLVLERDFPDPAVIIDDGWYHVFATNGNNQNIQYAHSQDLKLFTINPDALPKLGSWARTGTTWAPYVFKTGFFYTMWYSAAHATKEGWICIGVAKTPRLYFPFVDDSDEPIVCPSHNNSRGAIDPFMYEENGQRYILYSAHGDITQIFIQEVNNEGNRTMGQPVSLITATLDWEMSNNEAPTLIKHGSKYILFYSASPLDRRYSTGYAVSDNLKGPYVKPGIPLMTTDFFNGTVVGPGGEDVVTGPDGNDYIVYHGYDKEMRKRMLYVNHLSWSPKSNPVVSDDL